MIITRILYARVDEGNVETMGKLYPGVPQVIIDIKHNIVINK